MPHRTERKCEAGKYAGPQSDCNNPAVYVTTRARGFVDYRGGHDVPPEGVCAHLHLCENCKRSLYLPFSWKWRRIDGVEETPEEQSHRSSWHDLRLVGFSTPYGRTNWSTRLTRAPETPAANTQWRVLSLIHI